MPRNWYTSQSSPRAFSLPPPFSTLACHRSGLLAFLGLAESLHFSSDQQRAVQCWASRAREPKKSLSVRERDVGEAHALNCVGIKVRTSQYGGDFLQATYRTWHFSSGPRTSHSLSLSFSLTALQPLKSTEIKEGNQVGFLFTVVVAAHVLSWLRQGPALCSKRMHCTCGWMLLTRSGAMVL